MQMSSLQFGPPHFLYEWAANLCQVVGLGMQLQKPDGSEGKGLVRVGFVVEKSPAYRAGILPGDWLVAINGQPVDGSDKRCAVVCRSCGNCQAARWT